MPPAIDPSTIRAVVFDIGGVFLIPHHERIRPALAEVGIDVPPDDDAFHRAHHVAVHAISQAVRTGEIQPDEGSALTWELYDTAYFSTAGVPGDQIEAASAVREEQRRQGVSGVWVYPLKANIAAFARMMTERPELERAIVSNNDGSAEQQMLDHRVCQVGPGALPEVAMVIDSGLIGVAKPDPAIFEPVLAGLEAEPDEILYVGDTYQSDVLGATAAGLQVVQLDPYDLHHDYDHARVPDVSALAEVLLA